MFLQTLLLQVLLKFTEIDPTRSASGRAAGLRLKTFIYDVTQVHQGAQK